MIILLIAGIIMIICYIYQYIRSQRYKRFPQIQAVVETVEQQGKWIEKDVIQDEKFAVVFSYKWKDRIYIQNTLEGDRNWKKGDKITIYYDEKNNKCFTADMGNASKPQGLLITAGIITVIFGAAGFFIADELTPWAMFLIYLGALFLSSGLTVLGQQTRISSAQRNGLLQKMPGSFCYYVREEDTQNGFRSIGETDSDSGQRYNYFPVFSYIDNDMVKYAKVASSERKYKENESVTLYMDVLSKTIRDTDDEGSGWSVTLDVVVAMLAILIAIIFGSS